MEGAGFAGLGTLDARMQLTGLRLRRGRVLPLAAAGVDAVGYFQTGALSPLTQSAGISFPETAKVQPVPSTAP